jgi:hypothetical protein
MEYPGVQFFIALSHGCHRSSWPGTADRPAATTEALAEVVRSAPLGGKQAFYEGLEAQ